MAETFEPCIPLILPARAAHALGVMAAASAIHSRRQGHEAEAKLFEQAAEAISQALLRCQEVGRNG
jgi:hypothetical protein